MQTMQTFAEVRKLVRAGLFNASDGPVLIIGFAHGGTGSVRQFRTRSEDSLSTVPSLRSVLGDPETRLVPVAKRERSPYNDFVFIGRAPTNDIVFDDGSISKSHAAIHREAGGWAVKDNKSRNGTYVDGVRLDSGAKVGVASGAQVTFGAIPTYFVEAYELVRLALDTPSR
jgi:hypothetical protein